MTQSGHEAKLNVRPASAPVAHSKELWDVCYRSLGRSMAEQFCSRRSNRCRGPHDNLFHNRRGRNCCWRLMRTSPLLLDVGLTPSHVHLQQLDLLHS